jgi:hypothetical protein
MNISTNTPKVPVRNAAPQQTPETDKTITQKIVDGTVDSTLAATDRVSGGISGLATGTVAYLSKMPGLAVDGVKSAANLYRAEKIGPNIKVVATLASPLIAGVAVAGAGLGLVVAAGAGLVTGFSAHDSEKPRDFTIDEAVSKAWNKTRESVSEFGADAIKGSQEIREIEVKPGDKLWDIPLPPFARTAKTVAATVAGVVMGGVGGIATAFATTATSAWGGLKNAATDFSAANALGAVGAVVASPVTGVIHGLSKVVTTPIKAAAQAWKQDSLGAALKAGGKECFDTNPSAPASAAGGLVGGAVVAVPAAAATAVATTAVELGRGLKTAATDKELNLPAKALAAVGGIVSAPAAGVVHGITTGVGTPFVSAAKAWEDKSLKGVGAGLQASHDGTKSFSNAGGALVGGAVVGTMAATGVTASAAVREIGGGLIDAATNKDLNIRGKVLDGLGGLPGDVIATAGQGLGTLFTTPVKAAAAAYENGKASEGAKEAADFGVKSVHAAARPSAMVETVEV